MAKVTFDYSTAEKFISSAEVDSMKVIAENAKKVLVEKTGLGDDKLGWIDLPVDYDKEEFDRIKKAADKIQNDSEVLIVIGIGGSYLGARAAIEFVRHGFYNNVSKEIRKTPEIYYAGNSISSAYLKALLDVVGDRDFSVNIISKSGTTTEPGIAFRVFKEKLEKSDIPNDLKELLDYIPSRKVWIIGGDGWAYDIGYGGLDHVLHSNENINIMVLDTEVYSNTGGQKSKSTRAGSVAEFASSGKFETKKDLFRIAMSIPNVYVASISMGANNMQTLKALKEAYEHDGPSLIIAYCPCIEQGIYGGLNNSVDEQKLLVDVGYNILMRYNPEENKLYIDSKEPDFENYDTVFSRELRYKNLEYKNEEEYQKLYEKNLNDAKKRYNYFKNLEGE